MEERHFDRFFQGTPPEVDVEGIRRRWLALEPPYMVDDWTLPLPVWAKRGYTETGAEAWDILHHQLYGNTALNPLCVYLHIPFCSSKCGFCDSYSFKLGRRKGQHINEYVSLLEQELHVWSQRGNLSQRPVTTVHFGGGTPSFMGVEPFSRIVAGCREYLSIMPETEWALESTVTHLGPEMLACLHELGFRRLHLGVQTLEDLVRKHIGRRQTAEKVLAKTAEIVEMGWVVSVDLICGLPDQTLEGFLEGIKALWEAGVHGFSLYELLIYPQNWKWAERYGLTERTHLANYWMFQAGASFLEGLGYNKNLFNHWADAKDENVYFTFPTRGEDLLALGAIADGVFGDYHYRHPGYNRYRRIASEKFPGLEGGTRRNGLENALHPLTTAILAGSIPPELVSTLEVRWPEASEALLQRWLELELMERRDQDGHLCLTSSGSWFAGNMISQLVALYDPLVPSQIGKRTQAAD
jgi:coproporphyrinogen III oxidase-like Fe-S oxidoreductase